MDKRVYVWNDLQSIIDKLISHHINRNQAIKEILNLMCTVSSEEKEIIRRCNGSLQEINIYLSFEKGGGEV